MLDDATVQDLSGNRETGRHVLTELGFTTRRVGDELHGTASITPQMHVPGTSHLRTAANRGGLLACAELEPERRLHHRVELAMVGHAVEAPPAVPARGRDGGQGAVPDLDAAHLGADFRHDPAALVAGHDRKRERRQPVDHVEVLPGCQRRRICNTERPVVDTLIALTLHNLFSRHPAVKIVSIENGSSWLAEHLWICPFPEDDVNELIVAIASSGCLTTRRRWRASCW